jgi:putative ABC transport system substrate-binding protein
MLAIVPKYRPAAEPATRQARHTEPDQAATGQVTADKALDFAAQRRLPAIYQLTTWTEAGGLMAYGPNQFDMHRRAAAYVDKILKGAKPADLPVEQPTTFDFVINLKTARALGLTIPQSVLLQATDVIQ